MPRLLPGLEAIASRAFSKRDRRGSAVWFRTRRALHAVLLCACLSGLGPMLEIGGFAHAQAVRIPIQLHAGGSQAKNWPVSFGVPFARGRLAAGTVLIVVDQNNAKVPSQVDVTGTWEDGTIRWVRVTFVPQFSGFQYFLTTWNPVTWGGNITHTAGASTRITTGPASFQFSGSDAFPSTISVDANGNGLVDVGEDLVSGAGGAFYLKTVDGALATLVATSQQFEVQGPRLGVLRVDGEYRLGSGARVAAGRIYYHFYAGLKQFKVHHKLIVTTDDQRGLLESGLHVPLRLLQDVIASFNNAYENPASKASFLVSNSWTMLQDAFPHFKNLGSHCVIYNGTSSSVTESTACGEWAGVAGRQPGKTKRWGLVAQVPGFAEQFPKAFVVDPSSLKVELWSPRDQANPAVSHALLLGTRDLIQNYFGTDWIPLAHPVASMANVPAGTAKTHEIWLFPYLEPEMASPATVLGATREPAIAYADRPTMLSSGVFGPIAPKMSGQFQQAEAAIQDFFDRMVLVSRRVFPPNGYLFYGMHPYVGQGWEQDASGRWSPMIHRLSRGYEYNLKRFVWLLWLRGSDRAYFDYARSYSTLLHDLFFSNWQSASKPKGRYVLGPEDSPVVWGTSAMLSFAGSEDLIQFVYSYFLTSDFHARDMVLAWKDAMIATIGLNGELTVANMDRPDAFIRMLGSAYELDLDPSLKDFGNRILQLLAPMTNEFDDIIQVANYAKESEVFASYYDWYIATGDAVARDIIGRLARFGLRFQFSENKFNRHTTGLLAFGALEASETANPVLGGYLRRVLESHGLQGTRLAQLGMSVQDFGPTTTADWYHRVITGQIGRIVGLSAVMLGARTQPVVFEDSYPISKPVPSESVGIVFQHVKGTMTTLELAVTQDGGDALVLEAVHLDTTTPVTPSVQTMFSRRLTGVEGGENPWYLQVGTKHWVYVDFPASFESGQYRLTWGDQVAWRLLDINASKVVIDAPDGFPMVGGETYYFEVASVQDVDFYAYRDVQIFDPAGDPVTVQTFGHSEKGYYRFQAAVPGLYTVGSVGDGITNFDVYTDNYFRLMSSVKSVFAVGTDQRWFLPVDFLSPSRTTFPVLDPPPRSESRLEANGLDGDAYFLNEQVFRNSSPVADFPYCEGSFEMDWKPNWSSSDVALAAEQAYEALLEVQDAANPEAPKPILRLFYSVSEDEEGRTGRLPRSFLKMNFPRDTVSNGNDGNAISIPSQSWMVAGQWHHVVATWRPNGPGCPAVDSEIQIFVNGWKKGQYGLVESVALPTNATYVNVPTATTIRIGAEQLNQTVSAAGEIFDEVRIYRKACVASDFSPSAPGGLLPGCGAGDVYFELDFDGADPLEALVDGQPEPMTLVNTR